MKVTIIGTGRTGSAFAFALKKAGHTLHALVNRDIAVASKLGKTLGCRKVYKKTVQESLDGADFILIAVEDGNIKNSAKEIGRLIIPPKAVFVHTSGVLASDALKDTGASKINLGSFHPVQTIPLVSYSDNKILEGIYFGVEGGSKALAVMKKIASGFKSKFLLIPGNAKAEYHLSCVLASNFVVSNFYINELLSAKLGIPAKKLFGSQKPLLLSTVRNIEKYGAVSAVTGPVSRGDHETVGMHLNVLHRKYPEFIEYYKSVSSVLLKAAKKKNSKLDTKKLIKLLGK